MKRFYVDRIDPKGGFVRITGPEARHMTRVLRMSPGDSLVLMDGTGARYQAVIYSVSRAETVITLGQSLPVPKPSHLEITLCPALLKSRPMDLLIQKASELGVAAIQPHISKRSVVNLEGTRGESRLRHWREIAVNAAKQADRAMPARVEEPLSFYDLVAMLRHSPTPKILLWEAEESRDLKSFLRQGAPGKALVAIVGPEGGFHPDEVSAAGEAGFSIVSMGRRILRAETAALALAAVAQYEWGDMGLP